METPTEEEAAGPITTITERVGAAAAAPRITIIIITIPLRGIPTPPGVDHPPDRITKL